MTDGAGRNRTTTAQGQLLCSERQGSECNTDSF